MEKQILSTLLITVIIPNFAFGYIDPGTGSIIFQALIAAAFGLLFFLKKIVCFFRGEKKDTAKDEMEVCSNVSIYQTDSTSQQNQTNKNPIKKVG